MNKHCSMWAKRLSISLAMTIGCCGATYAQGMMEYAGVVGIPKPMPKTGGMTNMLNGLYGSPGKATSKAINASSTTTTTAQAANTASVRTTTTTKTKASAKPAKGAVVMSGDLPGQQVEAQRAAVLKITKTADATYKSGIDLKNKGKLEAAEVPLRQSLALRQRYWGDRDKRIPEIQLMLGEISNARGQDAKAVADLEGALASFSKFDGPGSDNRLKPLLILSDSQMKLGEKVKSYESYSQAYRLATRAKLDAYNPVTLRLNTVKMALGVNKYREAVEMCELATTPTERAKLTQDQLLAVMGDYAAALNGMNRTRDANEILAEAEKLRGSAPAAPVTEAPVTPPASAVPVAPSGAPAN